MGTLSLLYRSVGDFVGTSFPQLSSKKKPETLRTNFLPQLDGVGVGTSLYNFALSPLPFSSPFLPLFLNLFC